MNPDHHSFAPCCPSQTEGFIPELPLIAANTLDFLPLLLLSTLHVLEVAWNPLVLSALVDEFAAVFLESGDRVQRKLVIRCHQVCGAGNDHRRHGLV